jgi:hypothetical protein
MAILSLSLSLSLSLQLMMMQGYSCLKSSVEGLDRMIMVMISSEMEVKDKRYQGRKFQL